MRTKNELYQEALRTVALRRQTARALAQDAQAQAEAAIPALRHAEEEVRVRGIRCALAGAAGKDRTEAAAALADARQKLTALLAESGRPANALEPHFTCPKCGKKAEVYSRITGYYRPVQNWNDGKAQEYKNRTLYDVLHSKLKKVHTSMVTVTDDDVKIEPVETHKYLFTTNTCPNCRMAKKMLEGEDLEIIDAEKNPDMARQFGIMQAPTLVITDGEHLKKYVTASNIQKYVDEELD